MRKKYLKGTPSYRAYFHSAQWYSKRELVLKRAHNRCEACGSQEVLQVHHKTYDNLFREPLEDLQCLCKNCHKLYHRSSKRRIRHLETT